jgi:hypothetical protein
MWVRPADNDRVRVPGAHGNPPHVSTGERLDGHGWAPWAIVILLSGGLGQHDSFERYFD